METEAKDAQDAQDAQVTRNFAYDREDAYFDFRCLVRGRETKFTTGYDAVLALIGIETILIPVASQRANACAERLVRTTRQDCLDHILVVLQGHLESVLDEYLLYYNESRPHRGLQLDRPMPRPKDPIVGNIAGRDILDGIVHEYDRAA